MSIVYWRESAQQAYHINSMQGIALEKDLWAAYISCGAKGREVFRQCAAEDHEWLYTTVIAYADYKDNPPPKIVPLPKVQKAPVTIRIESRTEKEDTNATSFTEWMLKVKVATDADRSLSYHCGERKVMKDGTVSVPVSVKRGDRFLRFVSFVFHYHPGSKGATVGHGGGSKWHFKPYDYAQKWVRIEDHQFSKLDGTMVKSVQDIARGKKK